MGAAAGATAIRFGAWTIFDLSLSFAGAATPATGISVLFFDLSYY